MEQLIKIESKMKIGVKKGEHNSQKKAILAVID